MVARLSTIAECGYEKRGRNARAFCFSIETLEFLAYRVVGGIWSAAPNRDGKKHHAKKQYELVSALADRKASRPMHGEQRDQHLDRQRRRKEPGKQPNDETDAADGLEKHRSVRKCH